ncbi:peptidase inhibitor family I36 protein [Mucilaginibacter dorajii]|uniref:Beta/gamma crystallin 'Greek key' domain-containing protein n=1 Tax=Mucilaginibacter dorajii TaxID=692994 RepID=A0ABP7P457_9SPHI|nr:peptidase inhibitor family I36 protein [Mucilaginibacter dorajii]MCS3734392.1 hypothetical protein [Mucilaginibacter dorajii]
MSELVAKTIEGDFTAGAAQLPEVVVYWDINFGGANFRTNLNITYVGDAWNDQISSFIVVSGRWQFYKDINLTTPVGPVFSPGYYSWVENYGIPNDSISSFQCVGF